MKLDIKQIIDVPGEVTVFTYEMPLDGYELYGTKPFPAPVSVKGRVRNEAGVVVFSFTADYTLRLCCDRCLDEFSRVYHNSFEEVVTAEESDNEGNYVVAKDGVLDVDAVVLSDILLSLPPKQLCKEDCKGLCPKCGTNLNHASCKCPKSEADPRLAALGDLLQ